MHGLSPRLSDMSMGRPSITCDSSKITWRVEVNATGNARSLKRSRGRLVGAKHFALRRHVAAHRRDAAGEQRPDCAHYGRSQPMRRFSKADTSPPRRFRRNWAELCRSTTAGRTSAFASYCSETAIPLPAKPPRWALAGARTEAGVAGLVSRRSGSVAPLAAYQGSVRPNIRPSKTNGSVRRACTYLGRISLGRLPPCIGWTH